MEVAGSQTHIQRWFRNANTLRNDTSTETAGTEVFRE